MAEQESTEKAKRKFVPVTYLKRDTGESHNLVDIWGSINQPYRVYDLYSGVLVEELPDARNGVIASRIAYALKDEGVLIVGPSVDEQFAKSVEQYLGKPEKKEDYLVFRK